VRCASAVLASIALFAPSTFLCAQTSPHGTARITGIVVDSIHQSGLEGAEVMVSGRSTAAITDSLGRFSIDSLAPGTYQVGVFHPLLESLGISLASRPFAVGADSTGVANFAIPSVTTLAARYCGPVVGTDHSAVVAGKVLDPDTDEPVAGAAVSLIWVQLAVSKESGVERTPHELRTNTDSSGFFKFCRLDERLDAAVQASRGGVFTGEVLVSTKGAPLSFENLALAVSPASKAARGSVTGTVFSLDNKPLAGARVEAPMWERAAVTSVDGTFTLDQLPTGTQLLVVRHVGFEPTRTSINVTSRQPTQLRVTLGPFVNALDPVFVMARRNYVLEKSGFDERQRAGWGTYFTATDIEKRNPNYLSDMFTQVNGIRVDHSLGGAVIREDGTNTILGGGRGGSCVRMYVDGNVFRLIDPGDIDAFVSPKEVVGLEIYRSKDAPAQYRGLDECVIILVWTQFHQVRE
jgi:Carboxypeptidase regulatory-like domain